MKKYFAEFIGTALFVLFGCGASVAATALLGAMGLYPAAFSTLAVAAAFGLGAAVLALAFGEISGGHLNPVISLSLWVRGRMKARDALCYVVSQFAGGIAGAALLMVIIGGRTALGANGYDSLSTFSTSVEIVFLVEALISFTLVWVVLAVRKSEEFEPAQALYTGLAVFTVYIFAYPFSGASANPARSLGPAIFQEGSALSQVWVFVAAPVAGGLAAALLHKLMTEEIRLKPRRKKEALTTELDQGDDVSQAVEADADGQETQEVQLSHNEEQEEAVQAEEISEGQTPEKG